MIPFGSAGFVSMKLRLLLVKTLFLAMIGGSVFIASAYHFNLFSFYCRVWTILCVVVLCVFESVAAWRQKDQLILVEGFIQSLFLVGMLELIYVALQILEVLPSLNAFYRFTGSFNNPAILSMMLSLCVPCGIYQFSKTKSWRRYLWGGVTIVMIALIIAMKSRVGMICCLCSVLFVDRSTKYLIATLLKRKKSVIVLSSLACLFFIFLYYIKRDSADGRILIWRVCLEMIAERPLLGWGTDGFSAYYMSHQADYFVQHPNSRYAILADNINHPFNEFLLFAVKYGFVGLTLLLVTVSCLLKRVKTLKLLCGNVCLSMAVSLVAWSLCSYPYRVPFVWIITLVMLLVVFYDVLKRYVFTSVILCLLCVCVVFVTLKKTVNEYRWLCVQERASKCSDKQVLLEFYNLHALLKDKGDFLYNFGAILHHSGRYNESLVILNECIPYFNDYKLQMLLAHDLQQIKRYDEAVACYEKARHMVPSKYLPLYYEMKLYDEIRDIRSTRKLALEIIQKKSKKSHSTSIRKIKNEALNVFSDIQSMKEWIR